MWVDTFYFPTLAFLNPSQPSTMETSWGPAYLQVLASILVFALGIPALVIQARIPPDIQPIAWRVLPRRWLYLFLLVVLGSCGLLICLAHHPHETGMAQYFASALHWSLWTSLIGGILLVARPLKSLSTRTLIKRVGTHWKRGRFSGRFRADRRRQTADWLKKIGERARSAEDQRHVVGEAGKVMVEMFERAEYADGQLEAFAEVVVLTAETAQDFGTAAFFSECFATYSSILTRGIEASDRERVHQAEIRTLRALARAAVHQRSPLLATEVGTRLGLLDSRQRDLMEVSSYFVQLFPHLVVTPALRRLRAQIAAGRSEALPYLMGLCAMFRLRGPGSQDWLQKNILAKEPLGLDKPAKVTAKLTEAFEFLTETGQLEAADAVGIWLENPLR